MNDIALALTVGGLTGSRSMLGPAIAADHLLPGALGRGVQLLLAGECVADKHPQMPSRTDLLPMAGRMISGAMAAAALASSRRRRPAMAVAGAAGALVSTLLLYHVRRYACTRGGVGNITAGVVEDALALGGAELVSRQLAPRRLAKKA